MTRKFNLSEQYKTRVETDKVFMSAAWRKFYGMTDENIQFIEKVQLKDRELWKKLVSFFGTDIDDDDKGWRCEYWGKIMRGGAWVYSYTRDNELYAVLEETVRELLTRQDEQGRFSTYSIENEFDGWDMWGRKYVMLGLLHFYDICFDEELKSEIVESLKAHADYILKKIGKGKIEIADTSEIWGALNSSSILEPMVRLYNLTSEERYLAFSAYIVDSGIAKGFNLIDLAYDNEISPYEYPVRKAYEMMSCFEGLLEFWRVCPNEKYIEAVKRFVDKVIETDVSIIGCAGCRGEEFNNGSLKQSDDEFTGIMQETCVTVTWMKLCRQLFDVTGDIKYIEEFEKSAYNAMPGSVNCNMVKTESIESFENGTYPFDSYSPLILGRRGMKVGGYKSVGDFYYGCCAAIGAAGLGIIPLTAFMRTKDGFSCNMYLGGTVSTEYDGVGVRLKICSDELFPGKIKLYVNCDKPVGFKFKLRIPYYAKDARVIINGSENLALEKSFFDIEKVFENDEIEISYTPYLEVIRPLSDEHDYIAFKYGPYILARDARFCDDVGKSVRFSDASALEAVISEGQSDKCNIMVTVKEGDEAITQLIDYASAGKTLSEESIMEAWLPTSKERMSGKNEKI